MGIILYRIIRCVFVDCGWEFAALAGVKAGLFLQAAVWCGGLLFSEGIREQAVEGRKYFLVTALGAALMKTGSDLSLRFSLMTDVQSGIFGAAMRDALLVLAFWKCVNKDDQAALRYTLLFSAVCVLPAGAVAWGTELLAPEMATVAAPFFSMLGVSVVISSLGGMTGVFEDFSAWGFALGIMVSYGFDSMIR